jgi:TPR repeat protein
MNRSLVVVLAIALVAGCAAAPSAESEYNQGVEAYRVKDYAAARLHWSKAVEERELSALNNLGYLLYYGLGGNADEARAVQLWTQAAELGHSESQWHLGRAYEDGTGTTHNLPQAYAWYRCAIANAQAGPDNRDAEDQIAQDASKSLTNLLKRLPTDQIVVGEQLAKQYIGRYAKRAGA